MAQPLSVPDPVRGRSIAVPVPVSDRSGLVPVRYQSSHVPVREPVAAGVPDCERLDVYRVAIEFQIVAASMGSGRRLGALRDQLDRASLSIALNVAEGSGRFSPAEKAHFYLIARGSAMESLAIVTLMQARSLVAPDLHRRARALLTRILAMLTRLATSMQARVKRVADARSGG